MDFPLIATVPAWFRHAKRLAVGQWQKEYNYEKSGVRIADPIADEAIDRRIHAEILPIIRAHFEKSAYKVRARGRTARSKLRMPIAG